MEANEKLYSQNENIVRRDIADETILVPIRGNLADMQRIYALDPVADFIWQQLDGTQSLETIHAAILENFVVTADQVSRDLPEFIDELYKANLIKEVR
jgi:hypothetical protein